MDHKLLETHWDDVSSPVAEQEVKTEHAAVVPSDTAGVVTPKTESAPEYGPTYEELEAARLLGEVRFALSSMLDD